MTRIATFWSNRSGSLRETTAMFAVVVTIAGVGAALGLDRLTRDGDLPRIAILPPADRFAEKLPPAEPARANQPGSGPLDATPVASIPDQAQTIRLDPCTGALK
jgi:hypothetical protein